MGAIPGELWVFGGVIVTTIGAVLTAVLGRDAKKSSEAAETAAAEALDAFKARGDLLSGVRGDLDMAMTRIASLEADKAEARQREDAARRREEHCLEGLEWAHATIAHLAERAGIDPGEIPPPPHKRD